MLYGTKQLYGTDDMSFLEGELPFIDARIVKLEISKTAENTKHWTDRDGHLINKINESQRFWEARKKEIEDAIKRRDNEA